MSLNDENKGRKIIYFFKLEIRIANFITLNFK